MTTTTVEELRAKALAALESVKTIAKTADDAGRDFTADERAEVAELMEDARTSKAKADELAGDAAIRAEVDALGTHLGTKATPVTVPGTSPAGRAKTLGERFTEDERVEAWLAGMKTSDGRIADGMKIGTSPAIGFRGMKDVIGSGDHDAGAGPLVPPDYRGLLDSGAYARPLTLRDLVTAGTTSTDTVEFAREVADVTNNAAPVAEASGTSAGDGSGDVTGTKPESAYELERVTTNVKTIAHWVPATKRALSDAAQVRTLVDNFLRYGLEEELEDQIADGSGAGEDFDGILNTSGTQSQAWDTDLLVTTRKAKTKVRTVGRATATAFVLNPEDNEAIDLLRDGNDVFYFGGPVGVGQNTLWGLPRVESEAVPAGTGIVADWRKAVLWDREAATIAVSDSHNDFFVRNLVAILGELRAAFGVLRPAAFVLIDLTAGS